MRSCIHAALSTVLFMLMMALTLDRLLAVVLGLKYLSCCTVFRLKKCLVTIWCIGIAYIPLSIVLYHFFGRWFVKVEAISALLATSILFIMVALVTYAVIFWKFMKSRAAVRHSGFSKDVNQQQSSIIRTFHQSRFYVSILIILTYLLFNTKLSVRLLY